MALLATVGGQGNRAVRALQLETEIHTEPSHRAEHFVERWHKLGRISQRQYEAGDIAGYRATRVQMGDMAKSLQRDAELESLLANCRRELGISIDPSRSLGRELAFSRGINLGRGRNIGLWTVRYAAACSPIHVDAIRPLARQSRLVMSWA